MTLLDLKIDHVGAQGDGVALTENGPVFVPFTIPGDHVTLKVTRNTGELVDILESSSDRIEPVCSHFGSCGGCVAQHMSQALYSDWKLDIVVQALKKAGIDHPVERLEPCKIGERRRVVLTAKVTNEGFAFGYHQAGTNDIINIDQCPIAVPVIQSNLQLLKDLAQTFVSHAKPVQLTVLACDNGLDVSISADGKLNDGVRQAAVRKVIAGRKIIRLAFEDEILVESQAPLLVFGDTTIFPPTGSFVQASLRAEKQMVDLVIKHLKSCKKTADLFSGCGTFSFPLSHKSSVHAVETSGPALNAIDKGFRSRQGLKPITTERRDLFRNPVMRDELKHFQGVVFDPPRAGAENQSKQLARSVVKKVAAVSCNPATLARDLVILSDGGFKIKTIVAIDQFLWSPHVEVVALLER